MILNLKLIRMKNKIFSRIGIILAVLILFGSCKKWIDEKINDDPNKPKEARLDYILPTAEAGLAYEIGGDLSRPVCQWMQQYSGVANQALAYDNYNYTQSDVNNVWVALYSGPMEDLSYMIKKSRTDKAYYYQGIAEVLQAFAIGNVTDLFGDVPFSKAFNGENSIYSAFDTQESIYNQIFSLLDSAVIHLSANQKFPLVPGADDLIYQGDLGKWTAAAYSLKARYKLHLCKVAVSNYQDALNAIKAGAIADATGKSDLSFTFGDKINEWNPAYQYFVYSRPGDALMGYYFVNELVVNNDPRLTAYADTTEADAGVPNATGARPGEADGYALPGSYLCSTNSPVPFITFSEIKFIEAEAYIKTGDSINAALAFNAGVLASEFKVTGTNDLTFDNKFAKETASTISLQKIIYQKYFALYTQPEIFVDWRRTGYPILTPAAKAQTKDLQIARRYPYPTSEKNYNSVNFAPYLKITVSDKVWWDK